MPPEGTKRPSIGPGARSAVDHQPGYREMLRHLAVLLRNVRTHDPRNEIFRRPLERFLEKARELVEVEGKVRIEAASSAVFVNGSRVRGDLKDSQIFRGLCQELSGRQLGGLEIERGVRSREVRALLEVLSRRGESRVLGRAELQQRLERASVGHIHCLEARATGGLCGRSTTPRERGIATYQEALSFIRETVAEVDSVGRVNHRRARRVVHRFVDLSFEDSNDFSMQSLAAIKDHDHYTFNHMVNVCVLAIVFGNRLRLPRGELAELGLSALYHDLGKLRVPIEILNKPGKLTEHEWAVIGEHPIHGAQEMFPLIAFEPEIARRAVSTLQHHARYDGKGYPTLKGWTRQSLHARIIAIVDTFDAMTTKRVYQDELLPDVALRRLVELSGSHWDPTLVKAFVSCMGLHPAGSTVLLDDGKIAVVVKPSPDSAAPHLPLIMLVLNPRGLPLEPVLVDLTKGGAESRRIVRCVDPEKYGINAAHFAVLASEAIGSPA